MRVGAIENLNRSLSKLPGVGRRTAQRLTFHLLKYKEQMADLARALDDARTEVTFCSVCGGLTDSDGHPCRICEDGSRDHTTICVVETVDLIDSMENTGFRGGYHVLGGLVSPLDNIGPEDLRVAELMERIEKSEVEEVILVLSPTSAGDATASCVAQLLKDSGAKISRIATGLPVGSTPSLADSSTLTRAMKGRIRIDEPSDTEETRPACRQAGI